MMMIAIRLQATPWTRGKTWAHQWCSDEGDGSISDDTISFNVLALGFTFQVPTEEPAVASKTVTLSRSIYREPLTIPSCLCEIAKKSEKGPPDPLPASSRIRCWHCIAVITTGIHFSGQHSRANQDTSNIQCSEEGIHKFQGIFRHS